MGSIKGGEPRSLRNDALSGGDCGRAAFERLWRAYYRPLLAFAASYHGLPAAEREDAVAETLIAAFGALARYDPDRPLEPWLYRIAANRFADAARRAARFSPVALGSSAPGEPAYDPPAPYRHDERAAQADLAERCVAAIDELPEIERRVAQLRFYEDLSARTIGSILDMSAGTVRWYVHKIRKTLAAEMGEEA
jgi:RNA polymerase sigma-70 factor (ECF subfamily)